jgi:hypothetical protein
MIEVRNTHNAVAHYASQRLSPPEGGLVSGMRGDAGRSISINGWLTANSVGLARQPRQLTISIKCRRIAYLAA